MQDYQDSKVVHNRIIYSDVGKIGEISYIFTFFVETWCAVHESFIDAYFQTCHHFSDSALWLRRLNAQLEKERSKVIFAMKPHSSVYKDFSEFSSF